MPFKNIAVCLDATESALLRLQFAIEFCLHHDARLLGIHLTPAPMLMPDPYSTWAPQMKEAEESEAKRQEFAMQGFRAAAEKAGVKFDCVSYRSDAMAKIVAHARLSDLTIVGQQVPKELGLGFASNFVKTLILKLGRPVLVVPLLLKPRVVFGNLLIAWDGSREATRALADALPLISRAKHVFVLMMRERSKQAQMTDIDIVSYLTRRGVQAELEVCDVNETSLSDSLLLWAAKHQADLIVMGAYGHHRITELILGGMTHDILKKSNLPIFMSY